MNALRYSLFCVLMPHLVDKVVVLNHCKNQRLMRSNINPNALKTFEVQLHLQNDDLKL